ncbi:unnamed protein product [Caenorhabditis brenneri]
MKLLPILFSFFFLAFTSPVSARGSRCRSSTQCDYQSVCDEGYCLTIDQMFDKYDKSDKYEFNGNNGGRITRNGGYGGEHGGPRTYEKLNSYE